MSYPLRFVVCTYNLWHDQHWSERQEPLRQFLDYHRPDILCVQELCPTVGSFIDTTLPTHQRVTDQFVGWLHEGNIYWNTEIFELMEFGVFDIGQFEQNRRLFWVRLCVPSLDNRTLLVATAHYTWQGHEIEKNTGLNPRLAQARQTVDSLNRIAAPQEAILFMGDLNDFLHPVRILRDGGLVDSFTALGRTPPTHSWPTTPIRQEVPEFDDWICHRGPLRPMTSEIIEFFVENVTPSDHKPVMATYQFI